MMIHLGAGSTPGLLRYKVFGAIAQLVEEPPHKRSVDSSILSSTSNIRAVVCGFG